MRERSRRKIENAHNYDGYAHEFQEKTTFLIVFTRDFHRSARETVQILRSSCFFSFFSLCFGLLALLKTFRELKTRRRISIQRNCRCNMTMTHHSLFHLRWFAVKDVGWFNTIVHNSNGSVEVPVLRDTVGNH